MTLSELSNLVERDAKQLCDDLDRNKIPFHGGPVEKVCLEEFRKTFVNIRKRVFHGTVVRPEFRKK